MKNKTVLLGIDIQNDFSTHGGSLFVEGADHDAVRMASFLEQYSTHIDYIALVMDSHKPIHIANQHYWRDSEGYPPPLYSVVSSEDVIKEKWMPQFHQQETLAYLQKLENCGKVCTIWPTHCIEGTIGWAVNSMFMNSVYTWALNPDKEYGLFFKGRQELVEQYSIFSSLPGYASQEEIDTKKLLLKKLQEFENIIIIGESADVCVVNSLIDLLECDPTLAKRIIVLTDCMSWIEPYNERAKYLFNTAKLKGVRFVTSENYYILGTV